MKCTKLKSGLALLLCLCWTSAMAATQPPRAAPAMPTGDADVAHNNLIVRIDPKYPPQAARDGLNGWVMLSYTITENGSVSDISVLDSSPERVFDREARRALSKWKYKPVIKQGKPQAVPGVMVLLEFALAD
ncbi:hypothetical protein GCM10011338_11930 [Alteromonas lipolytica]|uniref:Protein TonB n=1 Tax=Alteromonas lipolytica TaxID=1856405 RepID=A0A1E8FCM8_9ALTE|nr:hypothetical protein BFC17_03040 [Alteromonas lipolytica]GGF61277.1 hypothetical protein GCM10011338_11930 [Alteromonas lipolytica]